jgi:FkbM family methyltransferase
MISDALQGVFRSLRVYHGKNAPRAAMDTLYRRFMKPTDLVFDVGAHVGDRISSFRRLEARVVALEPQPLLQRVLHLIHGRDPAVFLMPAAVAAERGVATLHINTRNPTVSTLSSAFLCEADGVDGWQGQAWDQTLTVPAVSLDQLIATFGPPAFIKIDIEGYEDEALRGLTQPVPALSFEFTTIARDVAQRCLETLMRLGDYRFDVALGESQTLTFGRWVTAAEMSRHLELLPHAANSGDVYAVLSRDA